jgi:hypothetical protein
MSARDQVQEIWLRATAARSLCAAADAFAEPPTGLQVYRGLTGPVLVLSGPLGSVELTPDELDAAIRLARTNGMVL